MSDVTITFTRAEVEALLTVLEPADDDDDPEQVALYDKVRDAS